MMAMLMLPLHRVTLSGLRDGLDIDERNLRILFLGPRQAEDRRGKEYVVAL